MHWHYQYCACFIDMTHNHYTVFKHIERKNFHFTLLKIKYLLKKYTAPGLIAISCNPIFKIPRQVHSLDRAEFGGWLGWVL